MGNIIPLLNKKREEINDNKVDENKTPEKEEKLQNIIEDYKYLYMKYSINDQNNDYKSELENFLLESENIIDNEKKLSAESNIDVKNDIHYLDLIEEISPSSISPSSINGSETFSPWNTLVDIKTIH